MKAEFGRALECAAADVEQRVTGGPKSDRPGQPANGGIGGDLDLLRLDHADPGHAAGYLDRAVERRGAALEGDDPPLASTVIRWLAGLRMRGQGHLHPRRQRAEDDDLPAISVVANSGRRTSPSMSSTAAAWETFRR